jgi:hypothetical protein
MKLRLIADTGCSGGTCPTAYLTDRGTAVVQGYVISDGEVLGQIHLPANETAVEIPVSLLVDAARQIKGA